MKYAFAVGTSNDRNAFSRPTSNASRMWSQSSLDFESDEGDTRTLMKAIAESLTELETLVGKLPTADWAVYPSSIFSSHEAKEDES